MSIFLTFDLLALILAAILTAILMPMVIRLAFRYDRLDRPECRKIHLVSVPRLGGMAFIPISIISTILILGFIMRFYPDLPLTPIHGQAYPIAFFCVAVALVYAMGVIDDIFGLRYSVKFAVQAVCAIIVLMSGLQIDNLGGILGIDAIPQPAASLLTLIFIIGTINAFNLIDGLDGLCAMLAAIAFTVYGGVFYLSGNVILSLICFSLIGGLSAFLCYNVFGNAKRHTKIFMGDSGSMTLGLIISICALSFISYPTNTVATTQQQLIYLFSPIMIPVFDAIRVFAWRISHRRNPFIADKNHIHHRLLAAGMSQISALTVLTLISMSFCLLNVMLADTININIVLLVDIIIWIAFNIVINRRTARIVHHRKQM